MIDMTDERAAEVLAAHNDWRRYNGDPFGPGAPEMGDPAEIGRAIDHAVSRFRSQPPAGAHCATCSCVPGMTPAVRFDTTPAEKEGAVRDHLIRMGWTPPAEAQAVALDYVPVKRSDLLRWAEDFARDNDPGDDTDIVTPFDDYLLQPFADEFSHDLRALAQQPAADGGFTAADMMDARQEGRKEAQQPAAVDGVAVLRGLLDEVRSHFTRDDDLPDDLLPRIDAALAQQGGAK